MPHIRPEFNHRLLRGNEAIGPHDTMLVDSGGLGQIWLHTGWLIGATVDQALRRDIAAVQRPLDPGSGYRLLDRDEPIVEGDERTDDNGSYWQPHGLDSRPWTAISAWDRYDFVLGFRRKCEPESSVVPVAEACWTDEWEDAE